MADLPIASNSDWSQAQIERFLSHAIQPMRVGFKDSQGFPSICSLWFLYLEGEFFAACHKNAYIVARLQQDNRVGFEIAPNDPPYRGVRGKGSVSLESQGSETLLQTLTQRYLQGNNQKLADWLISRADDELVLRITPQRLTAWDYGHRMEA